jgi:hypothetical protein
MLEFEEIYPKIRIYKNMWKDINLTTDTIINSDINPEGSAFYGSGQENNSGWKQWYTFGKDADSFNENLLETERGKQEQEVLKEIREIYSKCSNHYLKDYKLEIDMEERVSEYSTKSRWIFIGPSICKYDVGGGVKEPKLDLAMYMHTDYQEEYKDSEGYQFVLTCNMYLNDDYGGGDVDFLIGEDTLISYKPKSGDVIIFPSGHPKYLSDKGNLYYHGAKMVYDKPKYFIRNHVCVWNDANDEWKENEKIYGKEVWNEMNREKVRNLRKTGQIKSIDHETLLEKVKVIKWN